jgi:2-amino-4-hydroxy-6-hydroxymethyldihydropteridine diphosphokinase
VSEPVLGRGKAASGRRGGDDERDGRGEEGAAHCRHGIGTFPHGISAKSTSQMAEAYVAVGANLGDRAGTIRAALERLDALPGVSVEAVSSMSETDPVGPVLDQPKFLNGAARLETDLPPRELLAALLAVEAELGRVRDGPSGGPRPIDLDLLLYEDEVLDEPGLTLPHPRLHERRFVLEPLAELRPGLKVPGKGTVEALLAKLD